MKMLKFHTVLIYNIPNIFISKWMGIVHTIIKEEESDGSSESICREWIEICNTSVNFFLHIFV